METENAYQRKMSAQLKEWGAQINLLEAKMENVGAEMRLKRHEELQALRAKQREATEKMHELGKSTGEAWQQVKLTADKVWEELKTGLGEAQSKFK
ncbi:MAG: hypothetical protein H6R15_213 [Proteobacteria bacterium]|nr:hypothetical protein [Pseudomonadota bacterium]